MNSKQFLVLFFNLMVLALVNGQIAEFGALTTVALNGALTVPLITATAGTLAAPLAVLGVLKLGAAALYALGYLGNDDEGYEESSSGYGRFFRRRHRVTRDAEDELAAPDQEAVFALVNAMDTYGCGKQLICELEAKRTKLAADEALLLKLFGKKHKKSLNPASPKAEYELAAELGLASKNEMLCRARYSTCPYTAPEMMGALRNSHL